MDSSVSEQGGGADELVTPKQEVIMPEEEQPTAGPSSAAAAPSSDSPPEPEVPATSDQFPNSFQAVQRCVFCSALLTLSEKSKLLECLHAVCSGCLVSWSEGCTADATAAPAVPPKKLCPECQVTSRYDHLIENKFLLEVGILPANGASGNDSNGGSSTSTGSGSGSADSGTDSSEIKCNNCADVLATDWCDNCRDYICEACTTAHKQLACTKDHIIRPKDDIYIRKERSCFENYPCPNHPKELLLLYCNSCETMTCRDCQLSHFHRTHNYSYVNEIADDAKAEMKRLLSDVQYKSDIIHAAIDILDERTRKIAIKKSEILTEIKEIVTKLTEIVSKSGRDLMFAVNEACSTKLEVHRTHKKTLVAISKQAAHCTDFVKKALASSSNNCLLFGKHQILAHLNRIKGQKSQVPNPEFPIAISLYTANMDTLLKVMTNFAILKVDGHTYPPKAGDTIPTPPPLPLTASSGPCGSAQQQTHQHQQLQLLLHQAQQNHQQPPPTQHHHQVAGHHQQPPPPPYQVATTNQQQQPQQQLQQQPQQQLQQQPQQQLQQQQQQQQLLGHLAASQQHQQSQQQQLQQQQSQPQQSQPQQSQPQQQQQLQQQQSQLHNLVTGPQSTANHIVQLQQSQQMQFQRHQQQMELTRQQSNQQQLAATHTQQKQQQSQSKVLHPLQHMYYGNYRAGSSGTSLAGQSQSQTGQQQQQPMRAIRQQPQVTSSTHPPPQRQSSQVIMYGKHSAQTQPQPQQLQYMGSSSSTSSVDMNAFNTGGSGGGGGYHAVGQGEQTAPPQATVRKVAHGIPPAVRSTQQQHHQQQQHYQRAAHQQLQQINHSMMRGVHQPSQQVSQHQQLVRQLSSGPAAVTTSRTSPLSGISWHIPQPEPAETRHQQQGSSQGIILVAPAFSCGAAPVQDIAGQRLLCSNSGLGHDPASHHHPQQQQQQDSSFKIMLTKAATPPTPARTPTVTSSAPKTPSPIAQPSTSAHSAKGDDAADSLEKFCRESISVINDVMMTYTGFSTNGNSTTGGVSKRRSSSSRVGGVPAAPPTGLPTSSSMLHLASSKTENNMSESMVHSSTGQPTPGSNESHGNGIGSIGETVNDDPNDDWCAVCMDGGDLVCCDNCPKVFHAGCHIPSMATIPEDSWQCMLCQNLPRLSEAGSKRDCNGVPSQKKSMTDSERRVCERILLELYCQYDNSLVFRSPVPAENLEYFQKVTNPMSLDQVRARLSRNAPEEVRYTSVRQVIRDIRQVFRNAFNYFEISTKEYTDGMALEEFLETQLLKYLPRFAHSDIDQEASDDPTAGQSSDEDIINGPTNKKLRRLLD